jgi:hypothetical protein
MKDVLGHILSSGQLSLVEEMPDWYAPTNLPDEWATARGSTMPPSPLVERYSIAYEYQPYHMEQGKRKDKGRLIYTGKVVWAKHVKSLLKLMEPQQRWHRSRKFAVACGPLRINEMDRRLAQIHEHIKAIRELALNERESHEVSQIILQTTKKHLHINWDHIAKYIHEHIKSSLGGGGFKWRDALTIDREGWKRIFGMVKENIELCLQHPDWYPSNRPKTGLRARSASIEAALADAITGDSTNCEETIIDRCRIITFGNYMSLYTVFIPDKAAWYEEVIEKVIDYLKPEGEYYFPYMMGGKIYRLTSDLHGTDKPFTAADGKSWDASAGIILGKYLRCLMVPIQQTVQVATGQSHTSMDDTVAMIAASRRVNCTKVVLGDDLNCWGKFDLSTPVIEVEPHDTQFKYTLGLSFVHRTVPRITGLKWTADRGDKMLPLQMSPFNTYEKAFGSKLTAQIRGLHAGMYVGQFGEGTLIERLEKLQANDFKSPGQMFEELIDSSASETLRWAEQLGIKEVFIA